jgi:hypothetical protein
MGGIVAVRSKRPEKEDWFAKQGYFVNLEVKVNHDAAAEGNMPIYDIGRFSSSLPTANSSITKKNCEVYEHIYKNKLGNRAFVNPVQTAA